MTREEAAELTKKYAGREFVFHTPFENTPLRDGDRGKIVRLRHWEDTDCAIDEEITDLWACTDSKGIEVDVFGCEIFDENLQPIIAEHAATNWKPE